MALSCLFLVGLIVICVPVYSQFESSCAWDDFTLVGAQGYEIQCIDATTNSQYGIENIYLFVHPLISR